MTTRRGRTGSRGLADMVEMGSRLSGRGGARLPQLVQVAERGHDGRRIDPEVDEAGDLVDPRGADGLHHGAAGGDGSEQGRLAIVALEGVLEEVGALARRQIVEPRL